MAGAEMLWKRLSPKQLAIVIQIFSLLSIFFEGYDQGVMGGVNSAPKYDVLVGIGTDDGTITDTTREGGIVSIYYLGAIFGCFAGGYIADRIGRINGVFTAAWFALIGGALQAATQNLNMILCARVCTGIGTGALTAIVPVYIAETSGANERGRFLGLVFIANYLGISIAYWLNFGLAFVDDGQSNVRWRFLLGFQCIPALIILAGIKCLPDSARYYATVGRHEEALDVLSHLRGGKTPAVMAEYAEMTWAAKHAEKSSPLTFLKILAGRASTAEHRHLGRRAWICFLLQIMATWTGITAVTAYSPTLLSQAGYSSTKQGGLAGGINTIGIIGTIISAYVVDKYGRRKCIFVGGFGLAVVNFIAGGLFEVSLNDPSKASQIAPGAVTMLFLFNLIYASCYGTIAFLVPTELFPNSMRAQGNGFGVLGWATAVGMLGLLSPVIFGSIESRAYFLFGSLNLLWIVLVYLFLPETKDRALESVDFLFLGGPFHWQMERNYAEHIGELEAIAEEGAAVNREPSDEKPIQEKKEVSLESA